MLDNVLGHFLSFETADIRESDKGKVLSMETELGTWKIVKSVITFFFSWK